MQCLKIRESQQKVHRVPLPAQGKVTVQKGLSCRTCLLGSCAHRHADMGQKEIFFLAGTQNTVEIAGDREQGLVEAPHACAKPWPRSVTPALSVAITHLAPVPSGAITHLSEPPQPWWRCKSTQHLASVKTRPFHAYTLEIVPNTSSQGLGSPQPPRISQTRHHISEHPSFPESWSLLQSTHSITATADPAAC